MTTIELRFPAHRFHGTAWGRHVNEGVPEWPPSPYRLLRALYDVWKRKYPSLPEAEIEELLAALAAEAPRFRLPCGTAAHTRSYLSNNSLNPSDKSLIFDAFVAVAPGASCYVSWPSTTLQPEQRRLLNQLLGALNYLGRSESWIEAGLTPEEGCGTVCEPLSAASGDGEAIQVACAIPKQEHHEHRRWLDALAYRTSDLLRERRSSPPALRMVRYLRPAGALPTRLPPKPGGHTSGIQAVMLALDAPVLPLVTATVAVAERVRIKLMGIHKRIMGDPEKVSPCFSGKDPAGKPLEGHRHAFILPQGNDRGRIDQILIFAARSFDDKEIRTILRLRELDGATSDHPIRVAATWRGAADDAKMRPRFDAVLSSTPFVASRHWRRGRGTAEDFLKEEVRRECRNHGLRDPLSVDFLEKAPGLFEWIEYRRNRKLDPVRPGYGFRLQFAEPVATPFSLGYGCHFGLGQFVPER